MPTIIKSFGFKFKQDLGPGLVLDARVLANPFWKESLREFGGDHPEVTSYIESNTEDLEQIYTKFLERARLAKGPVWVGCTGGSHRSVYIAIRLGKDLGVPVEHLHIHL